MIRYRHSRRRWGLPAAAVTVVLLSASSLEAGYTALAKQLLVLLAVAAVGVALTLGVRGVACALRRRRTAGRRLRATGVQPARQ